MLSPFTTQGVENLPALPDKLSSEDSGQYVVKCEQFKEVKAEDGNIEAAIWFRLPVNSAHSTTHIDRFPANTLTAYHPVRPSPYSIPPTICGIWRPGIRRWQRRGNLDMVWTSYSWEWREGWTNDQEQHPVCLEKSPQSDGDAEL